MDDLKNVERILEDIKLTLTNIEWYMKINSTVEEENLNEKDE
jgi:hypothetical protein